MAAAYFVLRVSSVAIEGSGTTEEVARFKSISGAISEGAMAFLTSEYKYVSIFALFFSAGMVFLLNDPNTALNEGVFSAIAFLSGAFTSSACAFLGMRVATMGNVRTTIKARSSIGEAFRVAFESGAVMGFALVGLAVIGLITMCLAYSQFIHEPHVLMEMVAGFGLGGSTVAFLAALGAASIRKLLMWAQTSLARSNKGFQRMTRATPP